MILSLHEGNDWKHHGPALVSALAEGRGDLSVPERFHAFKRFVDMLVRTGWMPGDAAIKLKALEAFASVADGKATKIIIPSEIQGLAGLAASAKELLGSDK